MSFGSQQQNSAKTSKSLLDKDVKQLEEGTLGRIPEQKQEQIADKALQAARRASQAQSAEVTRQAMAAGGPGSQFAGQAAKQAREIAKLAGEQEAVAAAKTAEISERQARQAETQTRAALERQQQRRRSDRQLAFQTGMQTLYALGESAPARDLYQMVKDEFAAEQDGDPVSENVNLTTATSTPGIFKGREPGPTESPRALQSSPDGEDLAVQDLLPDEESTGEKVMNTVGDIADIGSKAAQGAKVGAMLGPVGSTLGAFGGGIAALIPKLSRKRQAGKKLEKLDPTVWRDLTDEQKADFGQTIGMSVDDINKHLARVGPSVPDKALTGPLSFANQLAKPLAGDSSPIIGQILSGLTSLGG